MKFGKTLQPKAEMKVIPEQRLEKREVAKQILRYGRAVSST